MNADYENILAAELAKLISDRKREYNIEVYILREKYRKDVAELESRHRNKLAALGLASGKGFEAGIMGTNTRNPFDKDSELSLWLW